MKTALGRALALVTIVVGCGGSSRTQEDGDDAVGGETGTGGSGGVLAGRGGSAARGGSAGKGVGGGKSSLGGTDGTSGAEDGGDGSAGDTVGGSAGGGMGGVGGGGTGGGGRGAGSGGTAGAGAAGSAGAGGESCRPVSDTAPESDQVIITGPSPFLPAGGTIREGTYHLASWTYYGGLSGGCSGVRSTTTWVFEPTSPTSGVFHQAQHEIPSGTAHPGSGAYQTNGTTFTFTVVCGLGAGGTYQYTATPTELLLSTSAYCSPAGLVIRFVRQ